MKIKKTKKKPKIRGIRTPRWIIFAMGFINGKILKTAGLDFETGLINSSYIIAKTKAFESYCHDRIAIMEETMGIERDNARKQMIEDQALCLKLKKVENEESFPTTIGTRDYERQKCFEKDIILRRTMITKDLSAILNNLNKEESVLVEEFQSMARKIESLFVTYANGMLLKSVSEKHIPNLDYVNVFDEYHARVDEGDMLLSNYLKEVSYV